MTGNSGYSLRGKASIGLTVMYLVVIAWLYVAVLMAVAEASSSTGSLLGGIITFFLYGLLPIALLVYLMATPLRRKARRARQASGLTPDSSDHAPSAAPAHTVAAVREKPD